MSQNFVWGSGGEAVSTTSLAERRKIAALLAQKAGSTEPIQHWTQGMARVADGLMAGLEYRDIKGEEDKNKAEDAKAWDLFGSTVGGGGKSAAAPEAAGTPMPVTPPASATEPMFKTSIGPNVPDPEGPTGDAFRAARTSDPSIRDGIIASAKELGVDPVHLATAVSYETAGTFDPTKKGPVTQHGQHRGLIQFGEEQAKANGVDWNNPVGSQLGPDGGVVKDLRNAGVKPGHGLMEIYSAINAGHVGLNHRTDENNGGAPGTVADKVNTQMAGHRAKAMGLIGSVPTETAAAPAAGVQVASADPNFVPQPRQVGVDRQGKPIMVGPLPPRDAEATPPVAPQAAPVVAPAATPVQQVAQAMPAQAPVSSSNPQREAVIKQLVELGTANPRMRPMAMQRIQQLQTEAKEEQKAAREEQRWQATHGLAKQNADLAAARDQREAAKTTTLQQDYDRAVKDGYKGTIVDFKRSGAVQVNTGDDGTGELRKSGNKHLGEDYAGMVKAGRTAGEARRDIQTLSQLYGAIGTGKLAEAKGLIGPYAQALGIKVEGLSEIQAADAILQRVAPSLRQPGSGSQSDAELRGFLQSLGSVGNSPEANTIITKSLEGMFANRAAAARIATQVLSGKISPEDAEAQIAALPDALAEWREKIAPKMGGTPDPEAEKAAKTKALKEKYGLE